jgi:hypothetical protein
LPFTRTTLLEVFFSLYGCLAVFICIFSGNVLLLPIIALQTIGFGYVAYLSIIDSWGHTSAVPRSRLKISPNNMNATSGAINNLHDTVLPIQIVKHMTSKFRLNCTRSWHILRSKALLLWLPKFNLPFRQGNWIFITSAVCTDAAFDIILLKRSKGTHSI